MSTSSSTPDRRPGYGGPVASAYPGERFGLPRQGPGSVAGWGRRFAALALDWLAALLVASALTGGASWTSNGAEAWAPMGVFLVEATVLTALAGGSFGQLSLRIAVLRLDRRPLNLLQALVRTFLICLVVPPLIFTPDGRGLHDLLVRTVTLRR